MATDVPTNGESFESPPVTVKDAVRQARDFLLDLYENETLPNLRLEEVELSDDGSHWLVTYGFTASEKDTESNALLGALGGTATRTRRDYKIIEIDARTGKPLSLKIRDL